MVQIILAENSQQIMTRIKTENFRIIIQVYLLDNLRLHFPKWITAIYKLEWKHCLGFRSIYGTLEWSFDIWDVTHEWIGIRMFCVRLTVDCWLPGSLLMRCLPPHVSGHNVSVSLCPHPPSSLMSPIFDSSANNQSPAGQCSWYLQNMYSYAELQSMDQLQCKNMPGFFPCIFYLEVK